MVGRGLAGATNDLGLAEAIIKWSRCLSEIPISHFGLCSDGGCGTGDNGVASAGRYSHPAIIRIITAQTHAGRGRSGALPGFRITTVPRARGGAACLLTLGDNPLAILNDRRHLQRQYGLITFCAILTGDVQPIYLFHSRRP